MEVFHVGNKEGNGPGHSWREGSDYLGCAVQDLAWCQGFSISFSGLMEMCLENKDFFLGKMLGLGLKQGALDMKSYAPTPLRGGRRGALSQTQPGHAVYPTPIPLF